MANVTLKQLDTHVPWRQGEIVTVQVLSVGEGEYECQTLETYPPDLKARHAAELDAVRAEAYGRAAAQES